MSEVSAEQGGVIADIKLICLVCRFKQLQVVPVGPVCPFLWNFFCLLEQHGLEKSIPAPR